MGVQGFVITFDWIQTQLSDYPFTQLDISYAGKAVYTTVWNGFLKWNLFHELSNDITFWIYVFTLVFWTTSMCFTFQSGNVILFLCYFLTRILKHISSLYVIFIKSHNVFSACIFVSTWMMIMCLVLCKCMALFSEHSLTVGQMFHMKMCSFINKNIWFATNQANKYVDMNRLC